MTTETEQQVLIPSKSENDFRGRSGHQAVVKHWYCYSYVGKEHHSGREVQACIYAGHPEMKVTMEYIRENKLNAGMTPGAVLVAVSYFGAMTKEEFEG